MTIIGESHIFRLDNFYTEFDNTTMYLQEGISDREMVDDIVKSALNNKIEVFTYIKTPRSTLLADYVIYGTPGIQNYLNDHSNIYDKVYSSLFLGKLHFTFKPFEAIKNMENINEYYMIGEKNRINQFKMGLIDKYAGNHPKDGIVNKDSRNLVFSIWVLIIIIVVFLTYYDIILQKKENVIRFTMGERISSIFWKNTTYDSIVFILIFCFSIIFLSNYTYIYFLFTYSLIFLLSLLILNALLYLKLFSFNIKEAFSNMRGSVKLLSINYTLKLITSIVTILIISSNIALIFESIELYKQKPFFKQYADYNYTKLENRLTIKSNGSIISEIDKDAVIQETFYRKYFTKFDATLLTDISDMLDEEGILANKNAFDYLAKNIKEIRDRSLDKEIYFILPSKFKGDSLIIDKLRNAIEFYEGSEFNYSFDVIYYKENVKIISIDEMKLYGSEFIKQPVIIFNNIAADSLKDINIKPSIPKLNYVHDIMYKTSDAEFDKFISEHQLTGQIVSETNVYEKYITYWTSAKRVLYINLIFSLLVILLEGIIISSIIKLEYEVNAIELSIKKILGYSVLQKNTKLIILTVITSSLSIISSIIISSFFNYGKINNLAIGGILILVLELGVIFVFIRKVERSRIQKILKGGTI